MTFERRVQVAGMTSTPTATWGTQPTSRWRPISGIVHFAATGSSNGDFVRHQIGPVIKSEELEYFRELHLLDEVRVTLLCAGLSDDASRFRIRNEFWKDDGAMAARITSLGGWLDLQARKLVPPPDALAAALRSIPRTEDYAAIRTSRTP